MYGSIINESEEILKQVNTLGDYGIPMNILND
jgi:hypothetical protein